MPQGWPDRRSERGGVRGFMCCDSVQSDARSMTFVPTTPLSCMALTHLSLTTESSLILAAIAVVAYSAGERADVVAHYRLSAKRAS
jgi:hypothetical protein